MTQCQEDLTTIYSQKLTLAKTIPKGFDILVSKYDQRKFLEFFIVMYFIL